MSRSRGVHILLTALLSFSGTLEARIDTATLLGTVKDTSGAVIPGATVTVKNSGTGVTRSVKTGAAGDYVVPDLEAGHYSLTVGFTRFKNFTVSDIELQVAQKASVDAVLEIGSASQEVTVTAAVPLLSTSSSSVGQVVDTRAVERMPLNGRSFWQLTQLTPGASYVPGGQGTRTGGSSIRARVVNVSINGTDSIWTGWSLDGANITEFELGGTLIQPNVDAIQEFKVEGANMPAEYGHTPTMVNATLKSGTNQFRGNAFEFLRNDALDASNFFFRPPPGSSQTKDSLRRNQYGATLGGPIKRDRAFFFADYEGTRLRQGQVFNSVVPSLAMRSGDFGELSRGLRPVQIVDPLTKRPFSNNQIPNGSISPQAKFFLAFMPQPNFIQGNTARAVFANRLSQNISKGDVKVDENLRASDRLMARYSIVNNTESDPNAFPALGAFPLHSRAQNFTLALTHIFNPRWLNEVRFGYYRSIFLFGGTLEGRNFDEEAGVRGFDNPTVPSFPFITIAGFASLTGSPSDQRPKSNRIRTWQYVDNLSYSSGKHEVKMGMEWFHQTHGFFNGSRSVGIFNFRDTYSGNSFADFLLGFPDNVTRDSFKTLNGNWDNFKSFYFQDNYRVTPSLTLNLGLRWEINPFYHGIRGQVSGFDSKTAKIVVPSIVKTDVNAQPGEAALLPLFQDRILFAGDLGRPESIRESDRRDFGPRLGFAWRPGASNNWVVRGAYGIFYAFPDTNLLDNTVATVPFVAVQQVFNDRPGPTRTWADFFRGRPPASPNPNPGKPCAFGFVAHSCDTPAATVAPLDLRQTYVQEWNLSVQRQISQSLSLDLAYVGTKTTRLQQFIGRNDPPPGPGAIQPRRPLPQWSDLRMTEWVGKANYNALQMKIESRGWRGLSLLGSYSYSKCIDTGTDEGGATSLLLGVNRAVCDFDRAHSFVLSYDYALPVGGGKQFLSGVPGWADQLIGGWEIAGITTLQSGLPFTPTISMDRANTGLTRQRPDLIAPPIMVGVPSCWFFTPANSACNALLPSAPPAFALPPAQSRYGTGGRNILRADGLSQFDFTLMKRFKITESKWLEFRSEFFNIFNHPTFSAPSAAVDVSSGGQVGSTLNAARTLQMALKVYF